MDRKEFQKNGAQYIAALIARAVTDGSRTAVVTGSLEIAEAVRIPANFTLILQDCHLRMADGCCENLFVNEHHDTDMGRTPAGRDRNISILGRGEAILDGGEYNGLSEKNHSRDGRPPIWKNNLILFTNVEGFRISGLECRNQRWWALNFIYCAHGLLKDLTFCASDLRVDERGNVVHGLLQSDYAGTLVKNADGIDLRQGCHHIEIENISGFTEDDTVALTALDGVLEKAFAVEGLPSDICHVTIRNVASSAFCSNVRLLNQGGIKLHHILVDGVTDLGRESPHIDHGVFAVRIGDTHMYGPRHATADETYDITVRNVRAAGKYAVSLAGAIRDLVLYGIECAEGTKMLRDDRNSH